MRHGNVRHRGYLPAVAAVVLVLTGAGLIGVAIASQQQIPQVPLHEDHQAATVAPVAALDLGLRRLHERVAAPVTVGRILPRSAPVGLSIPSIEAHSVLNEVGLTDTGALEVPAPGPHYDEAAWYRHSPAPGSLGPAVVLGHIDSAVGGPSVFFRLGELQPGDEILIERADGSTAIFTVDKVRSYPKDDFPTELVYGDIDHAGLRLLTCGGAFDDSVGHYKDNIVVFASLTGTR